LHHVIHGVQQISTEHTTSSITSNSILRITDFFNPLILKCRRKVSLDSNFICISKVHQRLETLQTAHRVNGTPLRSKRLYP
jgi:hypothetical protein